MFSLFSGIKSHKYIRIVGLNSDGPDTILTVIADGCKSLYYFYKGDRLISILDCIKTSAKGSDLKIGRDYVIIRPNDNSSNKQQLVYVVCR